MVHTDRCFLARLDRISRATVVALSSIDVIDRKTRFLQDLRVNQATFCGKVAIRHISRPFFFFLNTFHLIVFKGIFESEIEWNFGLRVTSRTYMGHFWPCIVQGYFGVIMCTCFKMAYSLKTAGLRAKMFEIWDSVIPVGHSRSNLMTFGLSMYDFISVFNSMCRNLPLSGLSISLKVKPYDTLWPQRYNCIA